MFKKGIHFISLILLVFVFVNATIDLEQLFNYSKQSKPNYIIRDNTTPGNNIDDKVATLGRVLFYDKNLSANNTIACASCHKQEKAFGDDVVQSVGLNGGLTGRHSMRLINSRFSSEVKFFWDERAATLEEQTTQPIQDHIEMGFSGINGDEDFSALILKLSDIDYYNELFEFAFGDETITENKIQKALAQFIRSIQSFDSKYDVGRALVNNPNDNFPNFTAQENLGKRLFRAPPNANGTGCIACHRGDEFDIDPNTRNNGVIGVAGSDSEIDLTNFRSPTLRDLVNPDGTLNGPLMHDGSITTLLQVIEHYNAIPINAINTNLDRRLGDGRRTQRLNLTNEEKLALEAFLKTLTGVDVYTNEKWSNPFDEEGNINLIRGVLSTNENEFEKEITVYPNPVKQDLNVNVNRGNYKVLITDLLGKEVFQQSIYTTQSLDLSNLNNGIYFLRILDMNTKKLFTKKFIKK